jgi:membrane protease YdiL (CAAX protease family)
MSIESRNSVTIFLQKFSLDKPILTGLILMFIALFFKWIDTFVLLLDERLGEIILSKTLGFILVIVFTWAAGHALRDIGLHSKQLGQSIFIGTFVTIIAFTIGYGVEYVIDIQRGIQPTFEYGAIDNKMGVTGGVLFALLLVVGNFINSFMEEGLFRGLMIPLFRVKLSFWGTNWLQAILFGLWHLLWVVKYYQLGDIETPGEIMMSIFSNSVPQLLMGLVWGYMYLKTGSLWTSWISHVITNSATNLLHINTLDGLDSGFPLRMSIYTISALLSMFLVKYLAEKFQMEEVQSWKETSTLT